MAVPFSSDSGKVGIPSALFGVKVIETNAPYPNQFAVTADGQRFLVRIFVDEPIR